MAQFSFPVLVRPVNAKENRPLLAGKIKVKGMGTAYILTRQFTQILRDVFSH